jgi:hypothetical protein
MTYEKSESSDVEREIITNYRFRDVIITINNKKYQTLRNEWPINWIDLSNKLIYLSYDDGNLCFKLGINEMMFNDKKRNVKFIYKGKIQIDNREFYSIEIKKIHIKVEFIYEEDYMKFQKVYCKYLKQRQTTLVNEF